MVSNAKRKVDGKPTKTGGARDADLGGALRSVYERAVEEQIPQEMLDLLGKLK